MASGPYTDPNYLVRQQVSVGRTLAGAASTTLRYSPLTAVRLRNVAVTVVTAGTVAGAAAGIVVLNGTTALSTISLSTNIAGVVGTSGDLNTAIAAGGVINFANGTDATFIGHVVAELHDDPIASSSWN